MSLRASASLPSSCSGAMYWNVPRIVPCSVSAARHLGRERRGRGRDFTGAAAVFARPKSRSFTPDFVSMTLPGFRSRWTIPGGCASSSASAISMPSLQELLGRERAPQQPLRERLPFEELHDEEVRAGASAEAGVSSNE